MVLRGPFAAQPRGGSTIPNTQGARSKVGCVILATIEPINVRSIARMLLYMTKVRGLQRMHPHLLRHACATHLLDNGCPLDVIAQILGHDNLDVTAQYAQVSTRLMMDTYNRAHPHAKQHYV
jgi:site-specific recombinase XerD